MEKNESSQPFASTLNNLMRTLEQLTLKSKEGGEKDEDSRDVKYKN